MPPKRTKKKHGRLFAKRPVARKTSTTARKKKKRVQTGPRVIRGPNGIKLKQQPYYKFNVDIAIYHYCASFLSLHNFKALLQRPQHGYVDALLGEDETLAQNLLTTPDDTLPAGCLEVGYLPGVFVRGGSALGFRLGTGVVEWLCFDRDVKAIILDKLDINTATQRMLFEHVADLARPETLTKTTRKLPYTEHRDWYESLKGAGRRRFMLGLSWRSFGWEAKNEKLRLKALQDARRQQRVLIVTEEDWVDAEDGEEEGEEEEEEEEEFANNDSRDTDSPETIGRRSPVVHVNPVAPIGNATGSFKPSRYPPGLLLPEQSPNTPLISPYQEPAQEVADQCDFTLREL